MSTGGFGQAAWSPCIDPLSFGLRRIDSSTQKGSVRPDGWLECDNLMHSPLAFLFWRIDILACPAAPFPTIGPLSTVSCRAHSKFVTFFWLMWMSNELSTGWPLMLCQTSCWHQYKRCVLSSSYLNRTFVLMSTGGLTQPEWSPCIAVVLSLRRWHSGRATELDRC